MASLILPPGAGEVHLHLRLTPLPDGSTAVDIDIDGAAARRMIRLADAARSLVEPGLPKDIERAEVRAARMRIVRAKAIRRAGDMVDEADFIAWHKARARGTDGDDLSL